MNYGYLYYLQQSNNYFSWKSSETTLCFISLLYNVPTSYFRYTRNNMTYLYAITNLLHFEYFIIINRCIRIYICTNARFIEVVRYEFPRIYYITVYLPLFYWKLKIYHLHEEYQKLNFSMNINHLLHFKHLKKKAHGLIWPRASTLKYDFGDSSVYSALGWGGSASPDITGNLKYNYLNSLK